MGAKNVEAEWKVLASRNLLRQEEVQLGRPGWLPLLLGRHTQAASVPLEAPFGRRKLWTAIQDATARMKKRHFQNLVDSMANRLCNVVANQGGYAKY